MPPSRSGDRLLRTAAIACLLLLAGGVFWSVQEGEFLAYDDNLYVTQNEVVRSGLTLSGLRWAWLEAHAANYHPLTWVSHMVDVELFGLDPAWHHRTNLLFHALNTVLLFWFLHRALRSVGPSFVIAALFCVHPTRVESVAWIAERKDVLSTFFGLLALLAHLRYVARPSLSRLLLSLLFLALGLLSKPMLVTLPFLMILLDYWPLKRLAGDGGRNLPPLFLEKVPHLVLAGAISVATIVAQKTGGAVKDLVHYPLVVRVQNGAIAIWQYLADLIWPSGLAVFYPHPGEEISSPVALLAGAAVLGVSLVVWRLLPDRPHLFVGWFWFLGTLAPVLGIVQVGDQARADRYTYLPAIGIFLAAVLTARDLLTGWQGRRGGWIARGVSGIVTVAVIGVFSLLTLRQVPRWRDTETLFRHALQITEENYVAHTKLAALTIRERRFGEAEGHAREALRINPRGVEALQNLGSALFEKKAFSEAAEVLRSALDRYPEAHWVRMRLGRALLELGRPEAAAAAFREAAKRSPDNPAPFLHLGRIAANEGDLEEARRRFLRAVQIDPEHASAHFNLGVVCTNLELFSEARQAFERVAQLVPEDEEARRRLAELPENP